MPTAAQAAAASLHKSSATQRFTTLITGKYFCTLFSARFAYRCAYVPAASLFTYIHDFVLRMFPPFALTGGGIEPHTFFNGFNQRAM